MLSKKTIIAIALLITIFTLLMLIYIIVRNNYKPTDEEFQTIPKFSFVDILTNNIYSNQDIENGKQCLIIYFNSECENCQIEAEQMSINIDKFKNCQILMISYEPIEKIRAFREKYKLSHQSVTFLKDSGFQFEDAFKNSSIPITFIYNKNKELVKQFKGEVKIETLLNYLA